MSDFIPFALPDIGEEEIQVVADAMRSGWLTTGPNAKAFEQEFAAYLGDDLQAIAVNSATAGLHLALEAIGVGPGDEVITTTHTFTASAEVARYLGAEPVLADIDPATLCISPAAIERAITPRTKAIIPVHYGGLSCDMDSILDIARRHGLRVIEDAAHALPASWQACASARCKATSPSTASMPPRRWPPAKAAWWSRATRRWPSVAASCACMA